MREQPESFLATVQIGITVIGAAAAAFGGATLAERLTPSVAAIPILAPYAEELALAAVVALVSYLSLVLGELVPKSLALRSSERYALAVARPLLALAWLTRPLIWLLTGTSNLFLRPFGDRTTFIEARLSPNELRQLVVEAAQVGSVDADAGEIAARAIDFGFLTVTQMMVPRTQVVAIQREATQEEILRCLLEEGHSRVPVYDRTPDDIAGYITAKDALAMTCHQQLIVLEDIIRPAYFVPASARAVDVLRNLQERHTHLAIVVDEHGGLAGIVTLEDLMEELVGEIFSEHDEPEASVTEEGNGRAVVQGHVSVREVNRRLGVNLPDTSPSASIGGLCISLAGRMPEENARFQLADGTLLEIAAASPRQVRRVRVIKPPRA
ncbi:MAG: HlyC/CorC family transporter [Deltaproteobacteria bacterium]|nr:HlyC/CorC family transporter [Deltaproteobacteria bacterium]